MKTDVSRDNKAVADDSILITNDSSFKVAKELKFAGYTSIFNILPRQLNI
jgi:hypothetical protein